MTKKMPREKKVSSSIKYDTDFLTLIEDDVVLPDGQSSKRVVVKHIGAAAVLPITPDGQVILVRQHRYVAGIDTLEIPAGKKDTLDEEGIVCAKRELEEETGYTATHFEKIQDIYTAIGFSDERIEIFLAKSVKKMANPPGTDEGEYVEVICMPLEEAISLAREGKILDAKTALALLSIKI